MTEIVFEYCVRLFAEVSRSINSAMVVQSQTAKNGGNACSVQVCVMYACLLEYLECAISNMPDAKA